MVCHIHRCYTKRGSGVLQTHLFLRHFIFIITSVLLFENMNQMWLNVFQIYLNIHMFHKYGLYFIPAFTVYSKSIPGSFLMCGIYLFLLKKRNSTNTVPHSILKFVLSRLYCRTCMSTTIHVHRKTCTQEYSTKSRKPFQDFQQVNSKSVGAEFSRVCYL